MAELESEWQAQLRQGRLLQQEAPALAAVHFQLALELAPDLPEVQLAMGQALLASGQPEEASEQLRQALTLPGAALELRYYLAEALDQLGRFDEARSHLQTLLRAQPHYAQAWLLMARLEKSAELAEYSLASYRRYLQLRPADITALEELAALLEQCGRRAEAAELFLAIYRQAPEHTQALVRWLQLRAMDDPALMIQLMIQLAREVPALRSHIALQMASLMEHASEMEERQRCLEMALEDPLLPERGAWQMRAHLVMPYLPEDASAIQTALHKLEGYLNTYKSHLPEDVGILGDYSNLYPYLRIWMPFSFLGYLNVDPLSWRKRWGEIFMRLLPEPPAYLNRPESLRVPDRPRLGFVINQNTAVKAFLVAMLHHWPAEQGQVVIFLNPPGQGLPESQPLRDDFEHHVLPSDPAAALKMVASARLDLLFLTEIYTDLLLQSFLACHRIAPVQVTSWLSSGTTGLPTIDYFISSRLLEQSEQPERFYSEKLITLDEIPSYILPPVLLSAPPPRSDYGLPDKPAHLYLCPHLIYKLHPDFDTVLAEILERDPEGHLVLLSRPDNKYLRNRLLARFEKRFPQLMPRIWFLPKLSSQDYLGLLTIGDVMLDPFYFGGGTTSYEALALGLPIVTYPGERLHGRITHGFYRKMGVLDCVAYSPQDYVRLAVELATRPDFNATVRERILSHGHKLFEDQQAVNQLADCLVRLARQQQD